MSVFICLGICIRLGMLKVISWNTEMLQVKASQQKEKYLQILMDNLFIILLVLQK